MKTLRNEVINNSNQIKGSQRRRNSVVVTIVGQEHNAQNGVVYFSVSPDMVIISELRFKIISSSDFSNVVLDGDMSLGWSGGAGVNPDTGHSNYYDLLAKLSGTSKASTFFDGGVHTLTFTGGSNIKVLMSSKYSARNR